MGAYRTRRPFVWQDEMAEVRNLFRKVAQVRDSGFTGFSLWKDEPTAETLSRNRLRRRRSQYAMELTHLNYGESPYDSLNHLHNIRGMCSRIQRQDSYVERKKKSYDSGLHPALLRRPVTSSYSWSTGAKEGMDYRASPRSSRPVSAPVMAGTPLHYTPSKPTMLYDATHKCPRYKEMTKRSSIMASGNRPGRTALKAMASNQSNWDTTTIASSGYSSPLPSSSMTSSAKANMKVAPSSEPFPNRRREYLEAAYTEAKIVSENENNAAASASYSEVESTEASVFSSSRTTSTVNAVERPISRMMSKRPPPDLPKAVTGAEKRNPPAPPPNRKDVHAPTSRESAAGHGGRGGSIFSSSPSPSVEGIDVLQTQIGTRPPSRKSGEGGGRSSLEEQSCLKPNPAHNARANNYGSVPKGKPALPLSSDGTAGLWALRQEQQRPTSAGAMMSRPAAAAAAALEQQAHQGRPSTSPTRVTVQNFSKLQERVSRFGSSPSANKISGKKEQLQVRAVQRAFDQELQQVALSEYRSNDPHHTPTSLELHQKQQQQLKASVESPPSQPQHHNHHQQQQQQQPSFAIDSGGDSFEQEATMRATEQQQQQQPITTTPVDGGEENHVMIKHSTDPYADFKHSMLRMIDEEDLYDKQWELEELFQYYMDLNPAVHHEVLQLVISDVRKNISTYKARRYYADSLSNPF